MKIILLEQEFRWKFMFFKSMFRKQYHQPMIEVDRAFRNWNIFKYPWNIRNAPIFFFFYLFSQCCGNFSSKRSSYIMGREIAIIFSNAFCLLRKKPLQVLNTFQLVNNWKVEEKRHQCTLLYQKLFTRNVNLRS